MQLIPNASKISEVIREISLEEVLPRFRQLRSEDISEKSPGDYLTIADESAEIALESALQNLIPGSNILGEERFGRENCGLGMLGDSEPCWIVDPIDGTLNFVKGLPLFATMVALSIGGELVGGWIYDPVHDIMALAEKGGGAELAGEKLQILKAPSDYNLLSGCLHLGGYDQDIAIRATKNFNRVGPLLVLHTAGIEYQMMLSQRLHYSLYSKINPWDHAPGQAILAEAGAYAAHLDGSSYNIITSLEKSYPLVTTCDESVWNYLRQHLFEIP